MQAGEIFFQIRLPGDKAIRLYTFFGILLSRIYHVDCIEIIELTTYFLYILLTVISSISIEEGDSIANTMQLPAIDCKEIIDQGVERIAEKRQ